MNILIVCHYFVPEPGAPSARIFELARAWVAKGHTVKVVTCFPNHPTGVVPPEYRGKLRAQELMDGVEVYRNWVYATPNEGFVRKTLCHISFMITSVLFSLFKAGPADVVIVSSPTFFSLFSGYVFSRVKRAPLIVEIRDLWPAAIVELGVLKNRAIIRLLEAMELWAYRVAEHVVVVTESFKENLVMRGVPADKVSVITNGVDVDRFTPGPKAESVEVELGCQGKHLVLYIGAHGISQALDTAIRAANKLRYRDDIVFGFVGEGAAKAKLQEMARKLRLGNVRFLSAQPKDRMPDFYRTADICLVPLKDVPLFKAFIPSKIFEIMACGRPIVAALKGEAADILERSGGAVIVPPEDPDSMAEAIISLIDQPDLRRRLGESGAAFASAHYSRQKLADKYEQLLKTIARGGTRNVASNRCDRVYW